MMIRDKNNIFERVENFHADLAWNYPEVKHVEKVKIVENLVPLQVLACKHLPTELLASPGERAGMLTQVGFCCTL